MLFFYIALLCTIIFGLRFKGNGYFDDFLNKKQTDAIKGVFIQLVFLSHILREVRTSGFYPNHPIDSFGFLIRSELGQLVIVLFLFYSGYGVMESIKKKGMSYIDYFPTHRLLTTLLNFDVAVLCFFLLNLIMKVKMSIEQFGWALIGWDTIGNSNWYIFVILLCYLITWLSWKVLPNGGSKCVYLTAVLVLISEITLSFLKHGQSWWYNTILCYPAGVFFSFYKEQIISFFKQYYILIFGSLFVLIVFLHFQRLIPPLRGLTYNVKSIAFAIFIVMVSMKVKTGNRFLYWTGANIFPIYIYQRIPMRAFRHWAGDTWICDNPNLYVLLCGIITWIIAYYYKHWQINLR